MCKLGEERVVQRKIVVGDLEFGSSFLFTDALL
jgi:hypothetical protein